MMELVIELLKKSKDLQGIAFMMCAYVCFGLLNVTMRSLYATMDPMLITTFRSLFCILIFAPFLLVIKRTHFSSSLNRFNFFKGVVDFISIPAWVLAVSHMNIPEVVGISYITPIICALLATIFLKDKLPFVKWVVMGVGIIGAYIILQPSVANLNMYGFVVVFTCILWASSNIMTKHLTSDGQHPLIIMILTNLIILLLTLPSFAFQGRMLTMSEVLLCISMSALAGLAYLSIAFACKAAKLSTLMPFDYFRIIFATIFAYIFFDQMIDITTFIGSVLIFVSSAYLVRGHVKEAKATTDNHV